MPEPTSGIRYFFEPKSIAVAGVSTDRSKLASIIYSNLLRNLGAGTLKASVYAVNPGHGRIGGRKCYPTIAALPEVPDLVIAAVPASRVSELVRQAAVVGVKAMVLITGGFAEVGRKELEENVLKMARRHGMRILGPNTMGLLDTRSGVDSLFLLPTKRLASGEKVASLLRPLRGGVVVIAQSGHLGEIVAEELAASGVGIRALVGTGNQLDVSIEDIIEYFDADELTKAIAVYLEGLRDGRRFMRLASAAAKRKPVVVFKLGKTAVGARAAFTHTASLVGDYEVYRAAFRESGIVEAESLQELVDYCVCFSMLSPSPGRRLLIITNAGGVGGVAVDEAGRNGLRVTPLDSRTAGKIREKFAHSSFISNASLNNPLDLTATASTADFAEVAAIVMASTDYDMALILPTHQTPAIGSDVSELFARTVTEAAIPVCVCVMGQAEFAKIIHNDFLKNGIPSFPTPERAVRALAALATYASLRIRAKAPSHTQGIDKIGFLQDVVGPLTPSQTRQVLSKYGIPQPRSVIVDSEKALAKARSMSFPVVCKLASREVLHKTEAGGVVVGVTSWTKLGPIFSKFRGLAARLHVRFEGMLVQEMAERGVELILGGTRDVAFGPTIVFGAGGTYTEVIHDYSVAVAPVSLRQARELVLGTKVSKILRGFRGDQQLKLDGLFRIISSFSRIMVENPSISQMEVNPMIASRLGVVAVDTRVVASPPGGQSARPTPNCRSG